MRTVLLRRAKRLGLLAATLLVLVQPAAWAEGNMRKVGIVTVSSVDPANPSPLGHGTPGRGGTAGNFQFDGLRSEISRLFSAGCCKLQSQKASASRDIADGDRCAWPDPSPLLSLKS